MKFNIAVVQFPGSTNDYDALDSLTRHLNLQAKLYWHLDFVETTGIDAVILPGGFTYGDALRAGAIAARSPAMETIKLLAETEGLFLDPVYTSCSMGCLIELCRTRFFKKDDVVVFLHTGGSAALFPYKEPLKAYALKKEPPWTIPSWSPAATNETGPP